MTQLSRGQLLARAARGGIALTVGGAAVGGMSAGSASAAIGTSDVPIVTLAVAAELLGAEFYTQLLDSKQAPPGEARYFRRALANENEHYAAVAKLLSDAGQTPGQASDFDFTFPAGSFGSWSSAAGLGMQLEAAFLGSYLGGVARLTDAVARSVFARIAASQAEHLSVFSRVVFNKPIGVSFPPVLTLEEGSAALGPFVS